MNKIISTLLTVLLTVSVASASDTIPSGFSRSMEWRVGVNVSPSGVLGTNGFLRGENIDDRPVTTSLGADLRVDFSFDPASRQGLLYRGLYQGIGVGVNSFFANELIGNPVSLYVYQGAPIVSFTDRLWLGYEWQFGAAMGWNYNDSQALQNNAPVSTPVTAHMGLGFKLHYRLSDRWEASLGVGARHYSNGNTSWPNAGINTLGATVGISYLINQSNKSVAPNRNLEKEADSHVWFYDITAYGAWRKRLVSVGSPADVTLCPGKFGILGVQFSPMYRLNRWVAVGPALDMQWDESANLAPYWVEGSVGDFVKFVRPPVGKQISAGLSAHAELTMPIFSVNAGLGYDFLAPQGEKRFNQSLTLKTFVTRNLYINTGYRLGDFKDPQNLMLGIGIRL